jgi:hypothetical protein
VDAADYTVWRDSLGGTELANETASLGTVDEADYDAWKANFGAVVEGGGGVSAVPEPGTLFLLVAGVLAAAGVRRAR